MKIYSFILFIYALFLTLSPGMEKLFDDVNESCCIEVCDEESKPVADGSSEHKDCSSCSPFSVCHCCYLLFSNNESIEVASVNPLQLEKKSYSKLSIPPTIVFTIWQPPKIA